MNRTAAAVAAKLLFASQARMPSPVPKLLLKLINIIKITEIIIYYYYYYYYYLNHIIPIYIYSNIQQPTILQNQH